ncbi:MAG: recombinase family protein [Holdemania massiliensis]
MIAMLEFPVPEKNIVIEKQSGKDFNRPRYRRLIRKMKKGDLLVIKSIDRLGRNYEEIIQQWRHVKKALTLWFWTGAFGYAGRDLTGTLIADLVLQLLSYVAQTERENIRQRQEIQAAKQKGVGEDRRFRFPINSMNYVSSEKSNFFTAGGAAWRFARNLFAVVQAAKPFSAI